MSGGCQELQGVDLDQRRRKLTRELTFKFFSHITLSYYDTDLANSAFVQQKVHESNVIVQLFLNLEGLLGFFLKVTS